MERIVVVGASLAGARCAEALRRHGFVGALHLVGDETHRPYERPPLSKQLLAGKWERDRTVVDLPEDLEAQWHLGRTATGANLDRRTLDLDDGTVLGFDGMVIATGASPVWLPGTEDLSNVFTLRTVEDSEALRAALSIGSNGNDSNAGGRRLVVIGGGFIGAEVAATAASNGVQVTVVDPLASLMGRALGDDFGPFFAALHSGNGVALRLGVGVTAVESSPAGEATACLLSDGSRLECDVVVLGIGVRPATGWLEGSGVALNPVDRGVECDATCAVISDGGSILDGIVAAGDVAWWYHRLFGKPVRVEHWENAVTMGEAAALRLLAEPGAEVPYTDVPLFWSDQFGTKIQFVGLRSTEDEVRLIEGTPEDGKFLAAYSRDGILTGALGVGRAARIIALRNLIATKSPVASLITTSEKNPL